MNADEWSKREFIGRVTTSTGQIELRMPLARDLIDVDFKAPALIYQAAMLALASGLTREEILDWPAPDFLKVSSKFNDALDKM